MSFWDSALPLGWPFEVALRIILAGGCLVFIVRYSMTNKWWTNVFGRHLISMSASLGALGLFSLLVLVRPDMPGRGVIRMVLFTLLALTVVWRVVVYERYWIARKREKERERLEKERREQERP